MKKEILIREFIQKVWNEKDFDSIRKYVARKYTICKDPSDPWEGRSLNLEEFAMRLEYTFDSFPDINFEIQTAISDENCVATTWLMTGTNSGKNGAFPPTNKTIRTEGSTKYHFNGGKICGHTQVFGIRTIMKQTKFFKPGVNENKKTFAIMRSLVLNPCQPN